MNDSNLDSKINNLIYNIDNIHVKTHPNICKLWKEYILNKKKTLVKDLETCNNIMNSIHLTKDPDSNTILTVYALNSI